MIEELLNPPMLKRAIRRLLEETRIERDLLQRDDSGAKQRADESGGSDADLEQLEGEIEKYEAGEAGDLSGSSGQPVWIPRDPIAALVQSTYDEFFEEAGLLREPEDARGLVGVTVPVSNVELAPEAIEFLDGSKRLAGRWLTRFGERDARFLSWGAMAKVKTWLQGKHKFPDHAAPAYRIGNKDGAWLATGDQEFPARARWPPPCGLAWSRRFERAAAATSSIWATSITPARRASMSGAFSIHGRFG